MLDASWPEPLRATARHRLADAVRTGRARPGDLVLFTSGSSGAPRAVLRSIRSWQASLEPLTELTGIVPDDVVWVPGPLSSSLFLFGAWHALRVGATPVARPAPVAQVTALHAVPALLAAALDAAETGSLPRVRTAVVAGDALPPSLRERATRQGWRVVEYYGAAELSFVAWREDAGPFRPFPGAHVEVRAGEVWVRSPYVARGYLDPADGGPLRTDGGWATVGDRGVAVPGGIRLLGRGGTAITTGGHTVVVEEVEARLREVDGVADVAVVAVPHAVLGSVVAAVVVPVDGAGSALRPALVESARALPRAARPRHWFACHRLPRTPAGKVDRAAVPQLLGALPRLGPARNLTTR